MTCFLPLDSGSGRDPTPDRGERELPEDDGRVGHVDDGTLLHQLQAQG